MFWLGRWASLLHEGRNLREVFEDIVVLGPRLALSCLLIFLEQEVGALLSHHGVVSLISHLRAEVLDEPRNAGPGGVARSSETLSDSVEVVVDVLRVDSLHAGTVVMEHVHLLEILFLDVNQELFKLVGHDLS